MIEFVYYVICVHAHMYMTLPCLFMFVSVCVYEHVCLCVCWCVCVSVSQPCRSLCVCERVRENMEGHTLNDTNTKKPVFLGSTTTHTHSLCRVNTVLKLQHVPTRPHD